MTRTNHDIDSASTYERKSFLKFACLFEGGLLLAAVAGGWATDIDPFAGCRVTPQATLLGIAGAVPMALAFVVFWWCPVFGAVRIKRMLMDVLGPLLDRCRWYDVILLAVLAGVCEEAFFRGWLQPLLGRLGPFVGLVGSGIVFGICHAVTPLYAVIAGVFGVYLSLLGTADNPANLVVPMIAHTVYDYLGFLVVLRAYRSE